MSLGTIIKHIRFTDDYKTQLTEFIDDYFKEICNEHIDDRTKTVNTLIEKFIEDTGERPDNASLSRLGHTLAWDYMEGDSDRWKMKKTEYPIATETMLNRERTGSQRSRSSTGLIYREVPIAQAANTSSDLVNHNVPYRRYY